MTTMAKVFVMLSLTLLSQNVVACIMGSVYNLPIPFGMYAWGAAGALIASFCVVAIVSRAPVTVGDRSGTNARAAFAIRLPPWFVAGIGWAGIFLLALSIVAGLVGSTNPLVNFNMTFFWIIFTLGLTYLTVFIGDIYAWANPWNILCDLLDRRYPLLLRGVIHYPQQLGYYPALALYMTLIWIELFGFLQPRFLSLLLIAYICVNFAMAWLVGKSAWFRYGELFSVYFKLIGRIAPVAYEPGAGRQRHYLVRVRPPFAGLLSAHAEHISLLVFVLFMLSSTAFDGVHETRPWVEMFWQGIYPALAAHDARNYTFWVALYYAWQSVMLLLSPLLYLAIYLALLWVAKSVARSEIPLKDLALRFAFTLVPIAVVYNAAHYFGELFSQGILILRMASDPFNAGWNVFGTNRWFGDPIVLDAGLVWHMQVVLILVGHIVSVYLAHVEALKVFPRRRHALYSQLPMLALMVLLTTIGLWILSLPIDAGEVAAPPDLSTVSLGRASPAGTVASSVSAAELRQLGTHPD
jgi:hypothetical protein